MPSMPAMTGAVVNGGRAPLQRPRQVPLRHVSGALPLIGDMGPSSDWTIIKSTPNPWGIVPVTAGGQSLTDRAKAYMARIEQVAALRDSVSTRHRYVPQSYLRGWSTEQRKKRIWVLHTSTGELR